jgi:predicted LPLAT superfamily acyltransferase
MTLIPPAEPREAAQQAAEWAARREQGSRWALQFMAWVAVTLGRPTARLLLHPITVYYVLFAPTARRHSRRYLQRALGRYANWRDGYRHVHSFASTVLDRIYFVRGQMQHFDIRTVGGPEVDASMADGRGAFLLGAHIGSFEALHAIGDTRPGLQVSMVMYPDNARMIHNVLQALAPDFKLGIIAIGRPGSTLAIRDALNAGGVIGILGDRSIAADGSRAANGAKDSAGILSIPFLGVPATFSDGPLRLALVLKRRVYFMVGLYLGGKRYEVRIEPLADFTQPPASPQDREALMHEALRAYVAKLEALVREAPYNWFNFYDFWNEELT